MAKLTGPIQSIVILNQSLYACLDWVHAPLLCSQMWFVCVSKVATCLMARTPARPPMICPGGPWPAVAKAVAQTRFFICSHAVGNSGDDYIPTRCLLIILNYAKK